MTLHYDYKQVNPALRNETLSCSEVSLVLLLEKLLVALLKIDNRILFEVSMIMLFGWLHFVYKLHNVFLERHWFINNVHLPTKGYYYENET